MSCAAAYAVPNLINDDFVRKFKKMIHGRHTDKKSTSLQQYLDNSTDEEKSLKTKIPKIIASSQPEDKELRTCSESKGNKKL